MEVFPVFAEVLLTDDKCEGVVIVVQGTGEIFKWKGIEETFYKERTVNFHNLRGQIGDKWPRAWKALNTVGKLALNKQVRYPTFISLN